MGPLPALRLRDRLGDTAGMATRCLLVDDSRAFLSSAGALLESQGMTVAACAFCADEAMAAAQSARPDVVLVDVELGDEDGVALTRSLLAHNPALHVVLISAYEFADIAELVEGCGAAGFISKTALGAQAIERLLD
jgi:DNA-binding NarL/FixJ family response regulator